LVRARDAKQLAESLERFLAGDPPVWAPERCAKESADRERLRRFVTGLAEQYAVPLNSASMGPEEQEGHWFTTEEGRELLQQFVAFCQAGSFRLG
jgi:hypothetical protein